MRYSREALVALGRNPEQVVVTTIEELPDIPEGYFRAIHLTHPNHIEGILRRGLRYERQGMLSSTARCYSRAEDTQYWTDDPRWAYEGVQAVVMHIPVSESRIHEDFRRSPGIVSPAYIVGVVNGRKNPS